MASNKVMKAANLKHVEELTLALAYFLRDYLPLANKHNCDLIADNLWDSCLPPLLASELDNLSKEQLVKLPGGTIDKGARSTSERCGPLNTKSSLKICSDPSGRKAEWDKTLNSVWKQQDLTAFVREAHRFTLPEMGILSSLGDVLSDLAGGARDLQSSIHVSHGMGEKKSHEIRVMADACGHVAKTCAIDHVIDIGSGRGYLGCHLALLYKLHVLGVDSSQGNTQSAAARSSQLQRLWPSLLQQSREQAAHPGAKPLNRRQRKKKRSIAQKQEARNHGLSHTPGSDVRSADPENSLGDSLSVDDVTGPSASGGIAQDDDPLASLYKPVTGFVNEQTDLGLLVRTHFGAKTESQETNAECEPRHNSDGLDTVGAGKENSADSSWCQASILLTGLHTCGDLAGSVLRLYAASRDLKALCSVGCCYHLISEHFLSTPMDPPEGSVEPGFPQSSVLRSRECQLGRNARMLASQSADRIAEQVNVKRDKLLHWRAVLQVILRDLTGEKRDDWKIGKIGAKCCSFTEYVHKALNKLHIEHQLSDADIADYERRYSHLEKKMVAFYYLRAVLAPCIEALILLDRLCYVLEQDCTSKAYLVQLFDPLTSPRCYAIFASKVGCCDTS